MNTTKVGIREFRENLSSYLEAEKPVAITRHGMTIGVYVPAKPRASREQLEALRIAGEKMDAAIRAAGLSEDELVAEFEQLRKADRAKRPASR